MRRPTDIRESLSWWRSALAGHAPQITTEAQCGWFRRRLIRGGPWVPARIWLHQEIDPETGELTAEECLRCEVDGKECDPVEMWTYLAARPISEADYRYMMAMAKWADKHAPDEPEANPQAAVDFNKLSIPF